MMLGSYFLVVIVSTLTFQLQLAIGQLHPPYPAKYQPLPLLRERAKIQDRWTSSRISRIPSLLNKYKAQAWLIAQREHAEDTLWWSIKNATDYDAHRRTILLFHDNQYPLIGAPNPFRWIDNTGDVWPELLHILQQINPRRIILNTDEHIAFAGGLHVGEHSVLHRELGEYWMNKTINEPMIAVEYVATKLPEQLHYYQILQENVWALLEEGFSAKVVQPGRTTTEDLSWWFRAQMQVLNVSTWNHPRVSVITAKTFPGWQGSDDVVQEGDILHIDFGITAMQLNTDTQHLAYVLRDAEIDAPESLKEGLKKSNRMQDIVLDNMKPGLTGNDVLQRSLLQIEAEGISGQFYCHPIGDWGHDAGSVIGFTNLPRYVPVVGDLPILPNTYYSIELFAEHYIPERNATMRFLQEENVAWSERTQRWEFVRGRQERFHLIRKDGDSNVLFSDQTQL